jgi:alkanesulfonate monooxygenase SsuD/methylene tetrahydromethanopterin reductase-like flavin-dependent oxidoreductase (luciferase family)
VLAWAREADAGPFSSIGIIDKLVFDNWDPMLALTAAAAVTERVRLMSTVILAPLHTAGVLAKQAATLDRLSQGRLTLGLGVGNNPHDFAAAPAEFGDRGRRFDQQLAQMKRIWTGLPPVEGAQPMGPRPIQPGGPELLIGAYTSTALRRVARWADGYIGGGRGPRETRAAFDAAEAAWREAGRPGRPKLLGGLYFGLGPNAEERGRAYIDDIYGVRTGRLRRGEAVALTEDELTARIKAFEEVGLDELICWPTIAGIDQVKRLRDVVG